MPARVGSTGRVDESVIALERMLPGCAISMGDCAPRLHQTQSAVFQSEPAFNGEFLARSANVGGGLAAFLSDAGGSCRKQRRRSLARMIAHEAPLAAPVSSRWSRRARRNRPRNISTRNSKVQLWIVTPISKFNGEFWPLFLAFQAVDVIKKSGDALSRQARMKARHDRLCISAFLAD